MSEVNWPDVAMQIVPWLGVALVLWIQRRTFG